MFDRSQSTNQLRSRHYNNANAQDPKDAVEDWPVDCFHTLSPRLHLVKAYFPPLLNMKGVHCIQLPLSGICIIWGQFKTDLTVNINLLSSAPDMVIT